MARLVGTRGLLAVAALSAAMVVGGCAALTPAPYSGRESCQGVGGIYTSDGRCLAGNA